MKKLLLLACASLIFTACGAVAEKVTGENETLGGAKPQIGDTVVFKAGGANYSEGKVEKIDGNKFEIRAGDYIAKPDAADVYALPKTGDYVIIKPQSDIEEWKFAVVTNVSVDEAEIKFGDGKTRKARAGDFIVMN